MPAAEQETAARVSDGHNATQRICYLQQDSGGASSSGAGRRVPSKCRLFRSQHFGTTENVRPGKPQRNRQKSVQPPRSLASSRAPPAPLMAEFSFHVGGSRVKRLVEHQSR